MGQDARCWATLSDGQRCERPSTFGGFFCVDHGRNGPPLPETIWREPQSRMPWRLVNFIRDNVPDAVFPSLPTEETSPALSTTPAAALAQATQNAETAPAAPQDPSPSATSAPEPAKELCVAPSSLSDDWLLAILRKAIEELSASNTPPLQKAGALTRLGNLYLKASRVEELRRANLQLKQDRAALLARLEAVPPVTDDASPAAQPTAPASRLPAERPLHRVPRAVAASHHATEPAPGPSAPTPSAAPDAHPAVVATVASRAPP